MLLLQRRKNRDRHAEMPVLERMEKFSVELDGRLLGCSVDDAALVAYLQDLFVQHEP